MYHKGANVKKRTALVSALRRALWENRDNLGSAVTFNESYKSIRDGANGHLHNPCGVIMLASEFLFIYGRKLKNVLRRVEPERFVTAVLWLPYKAAEFSRVGGLQSHRATLKTSHPNRFQPVGKYDQTDVCPLVRQRCL